MTESIKKEGIINLLGAVVILLTLTLAMYGDILFSSDERILSRPGTDLWNLFIYWRDFGFSRIRQGHLPLWNPHLFSGLPFLGALHSALLYPLNWIHLFLPLPRAINTIIVLHLFLTGFFMYLWTSSRGLHPLACLLSSVLLMFSGPVMMNLYAGQLTDICTMAWTPLLFLVVDRLFSRPSFGLCLLGIFVVTMQILAGHPQYVYYTAITVMIYSGLCFVKSEHKLSCAFGLFFIYIGAASLSAVQLFPGMEAASEGVRSAGVSYDFASQFSFPLENFITIIAPFFFGDMIFLPYWGKAYLWAMTFFVGISGFVLAICGAVYGEKSVRRFSVTVVLILMVLALGANTPLFGVLYGYVPGFNKFRGTSKFIFPATIFLIMMSGIGMSELIRRKGSFLKAALILGVAGMCIGGLAFSLYSAGNAPAPSKWWHHFMEFIASSGSYLKNELYRDPLFIRKAGDFSAVTLAVSAASCLLLAIFFLAMKYSRNAVYCIVFLAFLEVFAFAGILRVDFDKREVISPDLVKFFQDNPGDYRVLNLIQPNSALTTGTKDIWGYDPGVTLRYAQFIAFSQGINEEKASNYIVFKRHHKFFGMLRLRYIILREEKNIKVTEYKDFMPRLQLVQGYKVLPKGRAMLTEMGKDSFNPRKTVILESAPSIRPLASEEKGYCEITDTSTDAMIINVRISHNSILLVTDNYSRGWHARALPGSVQNTYEVMPANYTLMALPLTAGEHRFILEYTPITFLIGKWISLLALALYIIALICYLRKKRWKKQETVSEAGNH